MFANGEMFEHAAELLFRSSPLYRSREVELLWTNQKCHTIHCPRGKHCTQKDSTLQSRLFSLFNLIFRMSECTLYIVFGLIVKQVLQNCRHADPGQID